MAGHSSHHSGNYPLCYPLVTTILLFVLNIENVNSEWIEDLNKSLEKVKFLEESTGKKLLNSGLVNEFLFFVYNTKITGN
jgi:hypothetical protein